MSNCIKELYDYELNKKRSKCGIVKMKTNFYFRNTNQKDRSECIQCYSIKQKEWRDKRPEKIKNHKKQYYQKNREKIRSLQIKYYNENRDVIIKNQINYERKRRKTDVNFRLIRNTRRRIHLALNGKSKSSSTREIQGIDIEIYRRWIEWEMTPDMTWEIDHVKPICFFDVSDDEQLKAQPLLKKDHQQKGIKINDLDYPSQLLKLINF